MTFKRVLVIYKCRRFAPPKTNIRLSTKLKQTKSESVSEHNTLFLFAILKTMANLFHGTFDKSL